MDVNMHDLEKLKNEVVEIFKNNYSSVGDGIYFQSFTELHIETIDGVLIAEAVTDFVNKTASEIYKINSDIKIQFGLHASSVKNHIGYLEALDKRIEIIWEDCGSFPFNYLPKVASEEEFSNTLEFTKKLINLRGKGKTGLVYKGLMTLDWNHFTHQDGPYILGVSNEETVKNDLDLLTPYWRNFTADWMLCGKYAYEFTKTLKDLGSKHLNLNVAAQLSGAIWFPFALLSEILWSTEEPYEKILARTIKRKNILMP